MTIEQVEQTWLFFKKKERDKNLPIEGWDSIDLADEYMPKLLKIAKAAKYHRAISPQLRDAIEELESER